jgi:hypothetical protein
MKDKSTHVCLCEDSFSKPHNKQMSNKEYKQDGMCNVCADHVWNEMRNENYKWGHDESMV